MVRSRQEIMFTVLKEIGKGTKLQTRIMYASNLSWTPSIEILNMLLSSGLIRMEIDDTAKRARKSYYITEEGEKALDSYFDSKAITDQKWIEIRWVLDLLELEQSDEWCIILETLLRTTGPFTTNGLYDRLDGLRGKHKLNKLMDELGRRAIVTEYKILFPENWDRLGVSARQTKMEELGLSRGWHRANHLVFDREKFKELISESVENKVTKLLGDKEGL